MLASGALRYGAGVTTLRGLRKLAAMRATSEDEGPRLVLDNVRCFAHAVVPLDSQVTVIIGQNGSGKTTIAEATASLAPGEEEGLHEFPLRRGEQAGSIVLYGAGPKPIAQWKHGAGVPPRRRHEEHVFVYGQYRALRPPPGRRVRTVSRGPSLESTAVRPLPDHIGDALRRPRTESLFDFDEYLFRDLAAYIALLEERSAYEPAARAVWHRLREWFGRLDEHLGDMSIREQGGRRVAIFERAGLPLEITELSDGYRAVLAVVLDLVLRYTQLFSGLDDPLAGEGLVVVDEVDLNLHPRWQRRVIDQLTRLFPCTRFVLTTHSPAVVQAAIDEKRVILVLDEKPGVGTSVRPLTPADLRRLDGAEVDSVLVDRAAFRVASRYSLKYEALEREARTLREKVEEGTATKVELRRLLKILDDLQGLVADEERRHGTGPMLSEIARTQIALLKSLAEKKGAPARGTSPAKRRQGAR